VIKMKMNLIPFKSIVNLIQMKLMKVSCTCKNMLIQELSSNEIDESDLHRVKHDDP
jgi:hypothetical protein